MDSSDLPPWRPPPRRELQGPRPTPLNVRKDSHKIKKPPPAPQRPQTLQPPPQHRPPIIIYDVSPKPIHVRPSEFMSLVQRLTGSASSSSVSAVVPSSSIAHAAFSRTDAPAGALSPAARLATYESRTRDGDRHASRDRHNCFSMVDDHRGASLMSDRTGDASRDRHYFSMLDDDRGTSLMPDRIGASAGILSPVPSSLPAISPNLFSSLSNQNQINFFHEMISPAMHGINRSFLDSSLLPSPSNLFSTPVIPSPSSYWELFNQYQDL